VGADIHRVAIVPVGAERLAQPALVLLDEA